MTTTPKNQFILLLSLPAIIFVAALCYVWLFRLPQIRNLRSAIDDSRASLVIARDQQANLLKLQQDIATRRQDQSKLEEEMWTFISEDAFFLPWNDIAERWSVIIDEPVIADAVPGAQPISRAVTITITGTATNVVSAITAIQALKPLVSISNLAVKPAVTTGVTATLSGVTMWK